MQKTVFGAPVLAIPRGRSLELAQFTNFNPSPHFELWYLQIMQIRESHMRMSVSFGFHAHLILAYQIN